jgi:glycosyltransferase involved in cell wall biosynthesis
MKLVHIIEKFFNSGAASSLKQIYEALSSSAMVNSQEVICLKPEKSDEIKKRPSWFPVEARVLSYASFQDIAKNEGYKDAIFVFHKLMCSPTRMISNVLHRTGRPFFAINHTYADSASFNKLYNFKYCVAVSDHMATKLIKVNKDVKTYSVKNIVDVNYVSSYSGKERQKELFLTGRINSLNAIKYNADFIRWVCSLKFSKNHLHEYIGAGQYMNEACSICESSNNDRSLCKMMGSINDEKEKFETLKSWDVFLYHINRPEGTSMSVLESLACGVPVICCDLPGNNELIKDGVNGFVFRDFGHAESILSDLCNNKVKLENLKQSTIEWSRKNLTSYSLKESYENVLKDIADSFYGKRKTIYNNDQKINVSKKSNVGVKIDRRDRIKKIVAERYASSEKNRKIKKQIGSRILQKTNNKKTEKEVNTFSYYPVYSMDKIKDTTEVMSDFFGLCNSESCTIDYGGFLNFKEYSEKDFFMFVEEKSKYEIIEEPSALSFLKNNDILFVRRNKLEFVKNLINKKNYG